METDFMDIDRSTTSQCKDLVLDIIRRNAKACLTSPHPNPNLFSQKIFNELGFTHA